MIIGNLLKEETQMGHRSKDFRVGLRIIHMVVLGVKLIIQPTNPTRLFVVWDNISNPFINELGSGWGP